MSVADDMLKIRREFIEEDRKNAQEALMRYLHYTIAPFVKRGDWVDILEKEEDAEKFCAGNLLDRRAFDWVLENLWLDNLINSDESELEYPITLTPLGVEKFCFVTIE